MIAASSTEACPAAGAARKEVLELRAYKEKADAALALAERRIEELRQDLDAVAAKVEGAKLGKVTLSQLPPIDGPLLEALHFYRRTHFNILCAILTGTTDSWQSIFCS